MVPGLLNLHINKRGIVIYFDQMTNISLSTRSRLKEEFVINHIAVDQMQRSDDGTIKNAVKLYDGMTVESVLIPTDTRITVSNA